MQYLSKSPKVFRYFIYKFHFLLLTFVNNSNSFNTHIMTKTSLPNFQTRFIIDIQRYVESNYYFKTGNEETTASKQKVYSKIRIKPSMWIQFT